MIKLYGLTILLLLGVLSLTYSIHSCSMQRETARTNIIDVVTDSIHTHTDRTGTHYSRQTFTAIPSKSDTKLLSVQQKHLFKTVKATKKPVAVVETSNVLNYTGTSTGKLTADSIISFRQQNDTLMYKLHVNTRTRELYMDSLQVKNTTTLQVHEINKVLVATVTNSNPAMCTTTVESYTPAKKRKHTLLKVVLGVVAGIITGIVIAP